MPDSISHSYPHECATVRPALLDFSEGALPPEQTEVIRAHLAACDACSREHAEVLRFLRAVADSEKLQPDPRVQERFRAMLQAEIEEAADSRLHELSGPPVSPGESVDGRSRRTIPFPLRRVWFELLGAAALVAAGFFVGARWTQARSVVADAGVDSSGLAEVRERVGKVEQIVSLSLVHDASANERLRTVLAASRDGASDPRVIDELITLLAFDRSSSVRLSALEALFPHARETGVLAAVGASLSSEPSPVVQVAMVDFLASTREPAAIAALQKFTAGENRDPLVRQAAEVALADL